MSGGVGEPPFRRAWAERAPGQLIGKGHPAGDFLEAWRWKVLEEKPGLLRIRAHLPDLVKTRGRTHVVETRFLETGDELAVFALTTLREVPLDRPLGDV